MRRAREALGTPSHEARAQAAGKVVTLSGTIALVQDVPIVTPEEGDAEPREIGTNGVAVTIVPQGLEDSEEPQPKARSAAAGGAKLAVDVAGARVLLDGPRRAGCARRSCDVTSPSSSA